MRRWWRYRWLCVPSSSLLHPFFVPSSSFIHPFFAPSSFLFSLSVPPLWRSRVCSRRRQCSFLLFCARRVPRLFGILPSSLPSVLVSPPPPSLRGLPGLRQEAPGFFPASWRRCCVLWFLVVPPSPLPYPSFPLPRPCRPCVPLRGRGRGGGVLVPPGRQPTAVTRARGNTCCLLTNFKLIVFSS